jgi:hypothetical protein
MPSPRPFLFREPNVSREGHRRLDAALTQEAAPASRHHGQHQNGTATRIPFSNLLASPPTRAPDARHASGSARTPIVAARPIGPPLANPSTRATNTTGQAVPSPSLFPAAATKPPSDPSASLSSVRPLTARHRNPAGQPRRAARAARRPCHHGRVEECPPSRTSAFLPRLRGRPGAPPQDRHRTSPALNPPMDAAATTSSSHFSLVSLLQAQAFTFASPVFDPCLRSASCSALFRKEAAAFVTSSLPVPSP